MDLKAYLSRIRYAGSLAPNRSTLHALQAAHLYTVPFENLDVLLKRPITLDLDAIYAKIVNRRRGGFCYELNGLFAWLLRDLGFEVTYLSASDARADGSYGPDFDHLALLVRCPDEAGARWLADVGFGDTFLWPLDLDEPGEQVQGLRAYRLETNHDHKLIWQRGYDGAWERQYGFTLQPRRFLDFAGMCVYHQSSPESLFTRSRICSLATPEGRVSLDNSRLITTRHGQREERPVTSAEEYTRLLHDLFGIDL